MIYVRINTNIKCTSGISQICKKMSSKIQLRTMKMTIRSKNFQTRSDVAALSGEEGNFMSSTKGKK